MLTELMEPWDLNLRHLAAFLETCRKGSVNAAASSVSLSQPAVTQAIARLESQLKLALFDRQTNGMRPTEPARQFHSRVERALNFVGSSRVTSAQAKAFVALARGGSYAEASALTGLAPASLHRSISDLELALGRDLVERRGRGIELTKRGRETARQFRLARAELNAGLDELSIFRGENEARISVGAMPLCRAKLLPSAVVEFQKSRPSSELAIAEGSFMELIEPLRDGELDLLIGALRTPSPGPDVIQTPLFEDHPVFLGRRDHPLRHKSGAVTLEELTGYSWVLPPRGVPLREQWQRLFEQDGLKVPDIPVESGSAMIIRQLLMETNYLTVLSPDQVAIELEAGWLGIVGRPPEQLSRTIGMFTRAGWYPTEMQEEFVDTLKKHSEQSGH
ncbi:LysR family transcriptional regulator [Ponticaulis sp.]|uniref:LysR family transcriptional regulator n=1 Tax=Ponticaulis sp. TaxID=2020902 RepID=UPI0025F5D5BA|nr:LysR family transcriptional regulator [Ponticaulis sp.]